MRPEYEQIQPLGSSSFIAKQVIRKSRPLLSQAWHYHPEFEICYSPKSHGLRYVGNTISKYTEGDLVFLGSNLPHGFTTKDETEQIVIQFRYDFLGKEFFRSTEMSQILAFLDSSSRGFQLQGAILKRVVTQIYQLFDLSGFGRLNVLLNILDELSHEKSLVPICDADYAKNINIKQLDRVQRIFQFIEENYQNKINIEDACSVVNLTESAFYKFIKKHTNKKFTVLLNEYRVEHAAQLLLDTELQVSDICYQSGFNNLSHFNRQFKWVTGMVPSAFREAKSRA